MTEQQRLIDASDLRKYRHEFPNLIDDMELSPHAYRLYGHIKRRAGAADGGECYEGARKMAEHCKMSLGMIVRAKQELAEARLIKIKPGDPKTSTPDTITIVDVWRENFLRYQTCSPNEHPVQDMNTPVHRKPDTRSPNEQPCSQYERKKEPREERTEEEETPEEFKDVGSRAEPRSPDVKKMSEGEFMSYLKAEPAYSHIDIEVEAGKMRKWCSVRNKQPTRRRFVNWLNNVDPPMEGVPPNGNANTGGKRSNVEKGLDAVTSYIANVGGRNAKRVG